MAAARAYELTHNPLLLTAICLIHRDRGELPTKRWRLSHETVLVLLERWRRVTKRLKVSFPADDARKVLQPVAQWVHEQRGQTRATTGGEVLGRAGPPAQGKQAGGKAHFLVWIRRSCLLPAFVGTCLPIRESLTSPGPCAMKVLC